MRYLPVVIVGIGGVGLMFLLDSIFASTISISTGLGALTTILCYFITGVIAGAWANWRGASNGAWAAGVTWLVIFIISISSVPGYVISTGSILIVGYFIAVGVGALGGFVGGQTRR
jgi:hypothetical protein